MVSSNPGCVDVDEPISLPGVGLNTSTPGRAFVGSSILFGQLPNSTLSSSSSSSSITTPRCKMVPSWSAIALGLVCVAVSYGLWLLIRLVRNRRTMAAIPLAPGEHSFLRGHLPLLRMNSFAPDVLQLTQNTLEHDMVRIHLGVLGTMVILHSPDLIKEALSSKRDDFEILPRKDMTQAVGYNSLLVVRGLLWKSVRKALNPAFHFDQLKSMVAIFNGHTKVLLDKCATLVKTKQDVEVSDLMSRLTLDVIGLAAFGFPVNAQTDPQNALSTLLRDLLNDTGRPARLLRAVVPVRVLYFRAFRKQEKIRVRLREVLARRAKERRQRPNKQQQAATDLLDLVLDCTDDKGAPLDDETVMDQALTFILAGHETTATLMTWFLHMLAVHPEIDAKVYEEVRPIVEEKQKQGQELEAQDLKGLVYLSNALNECLRFYSPVPLLARTPSKDTMLGGVMIPKGTIVMCSPFLTHHNPRLWTNPEVIDPDRFLRERTLKRHRFAFLPFSAGGRNCIGSNFAQMEAKTVLAQLLARYRFTFADGQSADVDSSWNIVRRVKGGIRMLVTPR